MPVIQEEEYVGKRLSPIPGDSDYIHLSDLIVALGNLQVLSDAVVLDYGCGGSPYRIFFPKADYRRADFGEIGDLDYVIGKDSRISEREETFDIILSTQVAEHVMEPATYFSECFRLLKPGGVLICTTHGTYPDHGCPYDFQRWTADGLERDIRAAGFEIEKTLKLTTNGRAMMYLIQRFSGWFSSPSGLSAGFFRVFRSMMHRKPAFWQRLADKAFAGNRVVEASEPGHEFYLGLMVKAIKADV